MNRTLLTLPVLFLALLSFPQNTSDRIRSKAVVFLQPAWSLGQVMRSPPLQRNYDPKELQSLQLENLQLRSQLDLVYEWLGSEKRLREQADCFQTFQKDVSSEFLKRRAKEMRELLQSRAIAAFGRILYRDPSSWSSSCWIDVGEENNQSFGQTIVAKNSPVVSGSMLIGIVEYVGKRQSRVRLITDSGLKTAVRAVRGSIQEREIAFLLQSLLTQCKRHPSLKDSPAIEHLTELQSHLPVRFEDGYFAKGEILGSNEPYQRSLSIKLKGIGFNCDVADEEGSARDLRDPLVLQPGDLLVTTGLDGVFPPGLEVAKVTSIHPLKEGAFAYDLEAEPAAGNIGDLMSVFVLPPIRD